MYVPAAPLVLPMRFLKAQAFGVVYRFHPQWVAYQKIQAYTLALPPGGQPKDADKSKII